MLFVESGLIETTYMGDAMKKNQILLTFDDGEVTEYIKTVCRRKGVTLERYILENFEWDIMPICFYIKPEEVEQACEDCEYNEVCPDRFMGEL